MRKKKVKKSGSPEMDLGSKIPDNTDIEVNPYIMEMGLTVEMEKESIEENVFGENVLREHSAEHSFIIEQTHGIIHEIENEIESRIENRNENEIDKKNENKSENESENKNKYDNENESEIKSENENDYDFCGHNLDFEKDLKYYSFNENNENETENFDENYTKIFNENYNDNNTGDNKSYNDYDSNTNNNYHDRNNYKYYHNNDENINDYDNYNDNNNDSDNSNYDDNENNIFEILDQHMESASTIIKNKKNYKLKKISFGFWIISFCRSVKMKNIVERLNFKQIRR